MKSSLSFALLTISLFSFHTLPVKAVNISLKVDNKAKDSTKIIDDGQWCVRIPKMGLFCWDL